MKHIMKNRPSKVRILKEIDYSIKNCTKKVAHGVKDKKEDSFGLLIKESSFEIHTISVALGIHSSLCKIN